MINFSIKFNKKAFTSTLKQSSKIFFDSKAQISNQTYVLRFQIDNQRNNTLSLTKPLEMIKITENLENINLSSVFYPISTPKDTEYVDIVVKSNIGNKLNDHLLNLEVCNF